MHNSSEARYHESFFLPWVRDSSQPSLSLHHNHQGQYSPCARCLSPLNYDVTGQTIHGSNETWKLGTDVNFTNWLQHHCGKKTTIKTPGQYDQSHYSHRALPLTSCLIMTFTFFKVPRRYIMIKAIISCRVRCHCHDQLITTSLAKYFTAPQILKNLAQTCLYKLVKSLSSIPLC